MRALTVLLVAAFLAAACGKYGPPVRTTEPHNPAPATAPAPQEDPNAPAPEGMP